MAALRPAEAPTAAYPTVPGTVGYAAIGASAGRSAAIFAASLVVGTLLFVGALIVGRRMARRPTP